jgi:hypothetical protein
MLLGFRHVLLKSWIFVEKEPPRFFIEPAQNTLEGESPRLDALEQVSHSPDILHGRTLRISRQGPGRPESAARSGPEHKKEEHDLKQWYNGFRLKNVGRHRGHPAISMVIFIDEKQTFT